MLLNVWILLFFDIPLAVQFVAIWCVQMYSVGDGTVDSGKHTSLALAIVIKNNMHDAILFQ
jgi:hypothetical protein